MMCECVRIGRMFLVDLAGSERLKKSRSTGARAWDLQGLGYRGEGIGDSRSWQDGCSEGDHLMLHVK